MNTLPREPQVPRVLHARDVATIRGVSIRAARAWMTRLERRFGGSVVVRDGRQLTITEEALARVVAGQQSRGPSSEALEVRVRRQAQQLRALGSEQRELRELVLEHDAGLRALGERIDAGLSRSCGQLSESAVASLPALPRG